MAMNVKKGDTVIVLSGKDKGKQGKVLGTVPSEAKVVVEGINMVTCQTMISPMLPYLRPEPPRTRMHISSFAPVLSATLR